MSFHQDFQHRIMLTGSAKVVPKVNLISRTPTITKRTPSFTSTDNTGTHDLSLFTSQPPRGPFPSFDWTTVDGFPGRTSGIAQYPALLNSYSFRPPWNVSGVDYAVGYPSGTTFIDPATLPTSGAIYKDTGNNTVHTAANSHQVLDRYDFSLSGGWNVVIDQVGASADITNCKFGSGQVILYTSNAVGGSVLYNIFQTNNANVNEATLVVQGTGTYVVKYNWFANSYQIFAQFTGDNQDVTFKYNLLDNNGFGSQFGAHGDWIQFFGNTTVLNAQINFNTVRMTAATQSSQGWSLTWNGQSFPNGLSISNNTMVVLSSPGVNYAVLLERFWIQGNATIQNNYIDPTQLANGFMTLASDTGPYSAVGILGGQGINMINGNLIS